VDLLIELFSLDVTAAALRTKIDVAVISETHLKQKHADSSVKIGGYSLFRRDRLRRKGGGVVIYTRDSIHATEWQPTPRRLTASLS